MLTSTPMQKSGYFCTGKPTMAVVCPGSVLMYNKGSINPLYTDGLFHCYMLEEFICHFRGVRSLFCHLYSIFDGKSC